MAKLKRPLPITSVKVGKKRIRVIFPHKWPKCAAKEEAYVTDYYKTIYIRRTHTPEKALAYLLHEITHAKMDERLPEWAERFSEVFAENPELVQLAGKLLGGKRG